MILLQLDLVPNCVVLEAGTGSGSPTHALVRRVRPRGHVYTFDFHKHRAKLAEGEFKAHGISELVTVQHKDVIQEGFGEDLRDEADATFLDLPRPWVVVPRVAASMKKQEQVQRTCLVLKQHGFKNLATMEILQTEYRVSRKTVPVRELKFIKDESWMNPVTQNLEGETSYVVHASPGTSAGHTGYLTVALLPPALDKRIFTTPKVGS